jgi:hypothetical protein
LTATIEGLFTLPVTAGSSLWVFEFADGWARASAHAELCAMRSAGFGPRLNCVFAYVEVPPSIVAVVPSPRLGSPAGTSPSIRNCCFGFAIRAGHTSDFSTCRKVIARVKDSPSEGIKAAATNVATIAVTNTAARRVRRPGSMGA